MNNNCNVIAEIPIQQPVFRVIFVGEVNIDRLRTMDNLQLNERRQCIVRKNYSERLMLHFVERVASELALQNDGLKTGCNSAQV